MAVVGFCLKAVFVQFAALPPALAPCRGGVLKLRVALRLGQGDDAPVPAPVLLCKWGRGRADGCGVCVWRGRPGAAMAVLSSAPMRALW